MDDDAHNSWTVNELCLMTQDELLVKFNYCSQEKAINVLQKFIKEIHKSVLKSDVESLKLFIDCIAKIRIVYLNVFGGIKDWMRLPNTIVLACKFDKKEVLHFLLSKEIFSLISLNKPYDVTPYDEDEEKHNAFYYAIRSNDAKLLEILLKNWPVCIDEGKLDTLLARAFKELKLKNIYVSDEMELFVAEKLVNMRFLSSSTSKAKTATLKNVIERLEFVSKVILTLISEYKCEDIDDIFLFKAKFIAKNIFILKGQLKSTYDRIPWEEMYFFLVCYINTIVDRQKSKVFSLYLTKEVLLSHLSNFVTCLKKESTIFNENNNLRNLLKFPKESGTQTQKVELRREIAINQITKIHSCFQELYVHYTQIRDFCSLEIISSSLELPLSNDIGPKEGYLTVERSLQIVGEHLKNTLGSPKLSSSKIDVIVNNLSNSAKHILIDVRDSLSHLKSYSKRIHIVNQMTSQKFSNLLKDLKKLKVFINQMFFAQKVDLIYDLFEKYKDEKISSEILELIRYICSENFNEEFSKNFTLEEMDEAKAIIKQMRDMTHDANGFDQNLYRELARTLGSERYNLNHAKEIYLYAVELLKNLKPENYRLYRDIASWSLQYSFAKFEVHPPLMALLMEGLHNAYKQKDVNLFNYAQNLKNILEHEISSMNFAQEYQNKLESDDKPSASSDIQFQEDDDYIRGYVSRLLENDILENDLSSYKCDMKLQFPLEMFLLDKLNELDKKINHNVHFLDNDSPTLLGKNLRNHLAHENMFESILPFQLPFILLSNARNINKIQNQQDKTIDRKTSCDIKRLKDSYDQDLNALINQNCMFSAVRESNLIVLRRCLKNGADLNARHFILGNALHFAARSNLDTMTYIQSLASDLDINEKNKAGKTPLYVAVECGNLNIVHYLIQLPNVGLNITDVCGKTPLHVASEKGLKNIVKCLLKHNASTQIRDLRGYLAAHYAALNKKTDIFVMLFDDCKCTSQTLISFPSVIPYLHLAAFAGCVDIVDFLLSKDANVNEEDYYGYTPLHAAAVSGEEDIFRFLLSKKADIRSNSILNVSPLHYAVLSGNTKTVLHLLEAKAEIREPDVFGWEPLHYACKKGFLEITEILVKHGAKICAKNILGLTPLMLAAEYGHLNVAKYFLKQDAPINDRSKRGQTALHFAIKSKNNAIIKFLLNKGANIKAKDELGLGPLHWAALDNERSVIESLLPSDDIDDRNKLSFTPSLLAAIQENWITVEALIEAGANINMKIETFWGTNDDLLPSIYKKWKECEIYELQEDIEERELIHFCARSGKELLVKKLVDEGVNVDAQGKDGNTPLHLASYYNHLVVIKILISKQCDINAVNSTGYTPLSYAVCKNNLDVVNFLISEGADINVNSLPLKLAIHFGYRNIVSILLNNKKINIHSKVSKQVLDLTHADTIKDEYNFLHFAAQYYCTKIIKQLIAKGIKVDSKTSLEEMTPLHIASVIDNTEVVLLLLEKGADINSLKNYNLTPLHIAVLNNKLSCVRVLMSKGADYTIKDISKGTPIHMAIKYNKLEILKLIIEFVVNSTKYSNDKIISFIAFAIFCGKREIVEYLISVLTIRNLNLYKDNFLVHAILGGSADVVNYLISQNISVDSFDIGPWVPTPIAEFAKEEVLKVFLDNGFYFERIPFKLFHSSITKKLFATKGLHGAIITNNYSDVSKYIQMGAYINAKNEENEVPLHIAALKGYNELVDLLLQHNANPNMMGKNGFPLHYAARSKNFEIVKLLLGHGSIYNSKCNKNHTPLLVSRDTAITKLLRLIDELFNNVVIHSPEVNDEIERINDLGEFKAIVNCLNENSETLSMVAARHDFPLLEKMKRIRQKDLIELRKEALSYLDEGKYDRSQEILEEVLSKNQELFGKDNMFSLDIQQDIGEVLLKKHYFKKAEKYFQHVYEKRKKITGKNHLNTLHVEALMATALYYQGEYQKSVDKLNNIYLEQKQNLQETHLMMLLYQTYIILGLYKMGNLKEMNNASKQIIQCCSNSSLDVKNIKALMLKMRKEYQEAEKLYQEIFETRKNRLGSDHFQTLKAYRKVASLLADQLKYQEALLAYEHILEVQATALGWDHIESLQTVFQMADVFFSNEAYFEAHGFYQLILQSLSNSCDESSYLIKDTKENMVKIEIKFKAIWGLQGMDFCKILSYDTTNKYLTNFTGSANNYSLFVRKSE